jgi:hypothetical protein
MLAAVYLLLGSVVSVAVAWGFAAQFPWTYWAVEVGPKANADSLDEPVPGWVMQAFDNPVIGPDRFTRIDISAFGFTSAEFEAWRARVPVGEFLHTDLGPIRADSSVDTSGMINSQMFAYGWPLRAMVRHEYRYYTAPWNGWEDSFGNDRSPAIIQTGWYAFDLPNGAYPYPVRLPLNPLWLGMAANSIFYGAIIAALVAMPGLIRNAIRARRVRAGLCPSCRYPRGVAAVCSECGERLSQELTQVTP